MRPVWGADVPVSMPVPAQEQVMVEMQGFAFTQYRLVPSITSAEYETLSVPVYAPPLAAVTVTDDDTGIDGAPAGDS